MFTSLLGYPKAVAKISCLYFVSSPQNLLASGCRSGRDIPCINRLPRASPHLCDHQTLRSDSWCKRLRSYAKDGLLTHLLSETQQKISRRVVPNEYLAAVDVPSGRRESSNADSQTRVAHSISKRGGLIMVIGRCGPLPRNAHRQRRICLVQNKTFHTMMLLLV